MSRFHQAIDLSLDDKSPPGMIHPISFICFLSGAIIFLRITWHNRYNQVFSYVGSLKIKSRAANDQSENKLASLPDQSSATGQVIAADTFLLSLGLCKAYPGCKSIIL